MIVSVTVVASPTCAICSDLAVSGDNECLAKELEILEELSVVVERGGGGEKEEFNGQ